MRKPAYFEEIQARASSDWDQLEANRGLAGPWHQLFKQVQSPRHVLSELLQNADDAGATEAEVRLEDRAFVFEHNGEDFTAEHFASLCRFGYSNKRALHTIGFRGVGFKSTFSLGDRVELQTPTLSVAFHRDRFTEPVWIGAASSATGRTRTRVRVEIGDERRQDQVERNLQEWESSSLSLLFFRSLRSFRINGRVIGWGNRGPGPVPGSSWMGLLGVDDPPVLLIRSAPEEFPPDPVAEIQQERLVLAGEDVDLPPCQVEIVLGESGRLFVVLPTGVRTQLPFAINAPFIQDPARLKIKDPETSPTNRWLLERAGRLARTTMLAWLAQDQLPLSERAGAYALLPDIDESDTSLAGAVGFQVLETFEEVIRDSPILISWSGAVSLPRTCITVPETLFDVWPPDQLGALLDSDGRPALAPEVSQQNRKKLVGWGLLDEIGRTGLLRVLEERSLPQPRKWQALLNLWAFLAPEILNYRYSRERDLLRIIPAQGRDVLSSAQEVVRLGEKPLLQSEEDWDFLADHLLVMNPDWVRFLAEERQALSGKASRRHRERVEAAWSLLKALGLSEASPADSVMENVAEGFFSNPDRPPAEHARIAQIAARLGVRVGPGFMYLTRDDRLRSGEEPVLFDPDGSLERLLPEESQERWMLHPEYDQFVSCSRKDWASWIRSGRARIGTAPPIRQVRSRYRYVSNFQNALRKEAGYSAGVHYPYKTSRSYPNQWYAISDFDFPDELAEYWAAKGNQPEAWAGVARLCLEANPASWEPNSTLTATQSSTNGSSWGSVRIGRYPAKWIRRLSMFPCLPDTYGILRRPSELLRRTGRTEALLDVEPFLDRELDTERTRPLLDLLGVRSEPTGPERLLESLRSLAASDDPPQREVERWYRRLDQLVNTCSTEDFDLIRKAFEGERLILSEAGSWETALGVHLSADGEGIPGAPVVWAAVRHLTLWRKVGVAERPSVERAIQWLRELPSGESPEAEHAPRIRDLLVRHPFRVWEECRHWLALSGEWTPVDEFAHALTMQSLIPWGHFFPHVKASTADFRRLSKEVTAQNPFSALTPLSSRIEQRVERGSLDGGSAPSGEWLNVLGSDLQRVKLESGEETMRVRELGARLARTKVTAVAELRSVPYLDGVPAGSPRNTDVVWTGQELLVEDLPKARLARRVPEEVGSVFGRPDVKAALDFSFDRSPEEVREYLGTNFELTDPVAEPIGSEDEPEVPNGRPEPLVEQEGPPVGFRPEGEGGEEGESETDTGEVEGESPSQAPPRPEPSRVVRAPSSPPKPDVLERFVQLYAFSADGAGRFVHRDGDQITRRSDSPFPWERRGLDGDLIRCYRPIDRCLEAEPIQLDSEVWALLDQNPDTYALLLTDAGGRPVEVTGADLRARLERQEITLYPASYRLVMTTR